MKTVICVWHCFYRAQGLHFVLAACWKTAWNPRQWMLSSIWVVFKVQILVSVSLLCWKLFSLVPLVAELMGCHGQKLISKRPFFSSAPCCPLFHVIASWSPSSCRVTRRPGRNKVLFHSVISSSWWFDPLPVLSWPVTCWLSGVKGIKGVSVSTCSRNGGDKSHP